MKIECLTRFLSVCTYEEEEVCLRSDCEVKEGILWPR